MIWLPPYVAANGGFYIPPTDAQYEAMFRHRVHLNVERRKGKRHTAAPEQIPEFLKKAG